MPCLYIPNFDFEHQLASPVAHTPPRLVRLNAELATAWLAVAEDGDVLWTPEPIDSEFLIAAADAGLPRVTGTLQPARLQGPLEGVPWGWTERLRKLCAMSGWTATAPSTDAVAETNSREFSARFEREWNAALPGAGPATSLPDVGARLAALAPANHPTRWVIKAKFGMSGRERLLGSGPLTPPSENWIRKRIESDGAVFVEPWVERLYEVGLQFDIPAIGDPVLRGVVPLLSNLSGQYRGSWFAPPGSLTSREPVPHDVVETCTRAARQAQRRGYFGPLGIDSMCYRSQTGAPAWRPLQDINARWTMGRLSLGLRRLLQPGESGLWWHGTRTERAGLATAPLIRQLCDVHRLTVSRMISTTPDSVAASPCGHASAAVFFRPAE